MSKGSPEDLDTLRGPLIIRSARSRTGILLGASIAITGAAAVAIWSWKALLFFPLLLLISAVSLWKSALGSARSDDIDERLQGELDRQRRRTNRRLESLERKMEFRPPLGKVRSRVLQDIEATHGPRLKDLTDRLALAENLLSARGADLIALEQSLAMLLGQQSVADAQDALRGKTVHETLQSLLSDQEELTARIPALEAKSEDAAEKLDAQVSLIHELQNSARSTDADVERRLHTIVSDLSSLRSAADGMAAAIPDLRHRLELAEQLAEAIRDDQATLTDKVASTHSDLTDRLDSAPSYQPPSTRADTINERLGTVEWAIGSLARRIAAHRDNGSSSDPDLTNFNEPHSPETLIESTGSRQDFCLPTGYKRRSAIMAEPDIISGGPQLWDYCAGLLAASGGTLLWAGPNPETLTPSATLSLAEIESLTGCKSEGIYSSDFIVIDGLLEHTTQPDAMVAFALATARSVVLSARIRPASDGFGPPIDPSLSAEWAVDELREWLQFFAEIATHRVSSDGSAQFIHLRRR